jgi:flagellar hook protein FlgE
MSFYTSLTGLNGAQADISAISNNIANVGTTGFKRSRAEFGDIFATSPLQAASSAIGSGTILKSIKQQFTQGNIEASLNALDLAISGQGFFALKPSLTSTQTVYTRNGAFSVNNDRYVVDSQGQLLQVFPVNEDGSVIATGIQSARNLQLPTTSGLPKASETIQLGLNLPADAEIIPNKSIYNESNPYRFDKTNAATYNKSTSITIYDSLGNPTIATIYYVKTSNATETSPTNKWQTHVFVGDREVTPQLITAKDDQSKTYYINQFGQVTTDPQSVDPTFNAAAAHPLYKQDDQVNKTESTAASVVGGIIKTSGFDFGDTDANKVTIINDPERYSETREGGQSGSNPPYWGKDMFTISVDGSEPQSVSIREGSYTGTQLAQELTRAVNAKFSGEKYFRITDTYRKDGGAVVSGNDIIQINLSKLGEDGSSVALSEPIEIDLLGTGGSDGTPPVANATQADNKLQLTRDELIELAQKKLNDALNKRRLEFGKPANWPDADNPPIKVGYDIGARALTFTVVPGQLGADANEPASRFNSIQVFNPTATINDLGLPPKTTSPDTLIRANTVWTGSATLPSGDPVLDPREQRTGITVSYNKDTRQFVFASGSTGETSSITVGRATLAMDADVTSQIDSFDMSTLNYAANQVVQLEIDGRTFTYNYTGSVGNTATNFFNEVEQAIPVSFVDAHTTQEGTTTTKEVQEVNVHGLLQNGDAFSVEISDPGATSTSTFSTSALSLTSSSTISQRLDALVTAINAAKGALKFTASRSGNKLIFNYSENGSVGPLVSIKQTQRGSDAGLAAIKFTDRTVTTASRSSINGSATTATKLSVTLKSVDATSPSIAASDVYRISLPLSDGSIKTVDVTAGGTTLAALATAAGAAFSNVTFEASGDMLTATYKSNGSVTGNMTIEQVKKSGVSVTTYANSTVSVATTTPGAAVTAAVYKASFSANTTFANTNTVTITLYGATAQTLTLSNGTGLAEIPALAAANATLNNLATFTVVNGELVITYKADGAISTAPIVATNAQASSTTISTVQVRPDFIGPISIKHSSYNLEVEGDPNGLAFNLNMRINGIPKASLPVGAQGSTSRNGLQIGQAKTINYAGTNDLLGVGGSTSTRFVAGTGLESSAATALGTRAITPMGQTFFLNESLGENEMTFTIDGIVGTISLPIRAYTGDTFAAAIQDRVNQIQDSKTGRIVSGVTVRFEPDDNRLVFTSGTTGPNSQINVVGHPNFGLGKVTQTPGSVPIITNLQQATDEQGNKLYVDGDGNITTQAPTTIQNWYPLYLTEGQLTFDTIGKLISPKEGVIYSPFDPQNGSDLLRLNIDYGKYSTQFSSPFSVLSLSQDGYPSGSLNGLDIDAGGTVRANYTNGQTVALGKVMIANFANPNGLKQVGNANYVATSTSGQVVLGQAGADGFGTIKAGALERSNVDITEELVNLITAQRNFQANAKAIETTTTLSQTIIQIRS